MIPAAARTPLAVLRGSFWATSRFANTKLWLYERWLAFDTHAVGRRVIHRIRYDRVASIDIVDGRLFSDVIVRTCSGAEFLVDGVPRGRVDEARPLLAALTTSRIEL